MFIIISLYRVYSPDYTLIAAHTHMYTYIHCARGRLWAYSTSLCFDTVTVLSACTMNECIVHVYRFQEIRLIYIYRHTHVHRCCLALILVAYVMDALMTMLTAQDTLNNNNNTNNNNK